MKRYILPILPLFLALCLTVGCGGQSGMHSRLAAVDSIVDSHYDSALGGTFYGNTLLSLLILK